MEIKILGTRGEIAVSAPKHQYHSGVLLDQKIMFDVGEKAFLQENPEYILITHLHPDHAFFVLDKESFDTKTVFFAPEKPKNFPFLKVLSKSFIVDNYQITPIPTIHSKKVKSQAYLVEIKQKRLLYTGDMIWIEKKYWNTLSRLDLVITEASFLKSGGMVRRDKITGELWGHQGIPNLMHFFKKFTNRIIFVHFGSWFYKNIRESQKQLMQIGKKNDLEVIVGYDGMKISI